MGVYSRHYCEKEGYKVIYLIAYRIKLDRYKIGFIAYISVISLLYKSTLKYISISLCQIPL